MVAFRRNSVVSIQPTNTPTNLLKLPTTPMDIIAVSDEEIEQSEQFVRHTGQFHKNEIIQTEPLQTRPIHDEQIHQTKPFSCEHCGRRYTYESSLHRHERKHSTHREYACNDCPGKFKHAWGLKAHQITQHFNDHEQDNQKNPEFMCSECGRVFKNEFTLNLHKECIHRNPNPQECGLCRKMFATKASLSSHYHKEHKGKEKPSCGICGCRFYDQYSLRRHKKLLHPNDQEKGIQTREGQT